MLPRLLVYAAVLVTLTAGVTLGSLDEILKARHPPGAASYGIADLTRAPFKFDYGRVKQVVDDSWQLDPPAGFPRAKALVHAHVVVDCLFAAAYAYLLFLLARRLAEALGEVTGDPTKLTSVAERRVRGRSPEATEQAVASEARELEPVLKRYRKFALRTASLESPIASTAGCNPVVIDSDTAGRRLTCTATSFGGTASVSVTIKRDATPAVTCEPTPATLWPPNHRLMPVVVDVIIDDATSGPGALELSDVWSSDGDQASDIVGFDLGTPDVEGLLRAERSGAADERSYRLTYEARDAAGNGSECIATVAIPHDQGD